MYYFMVKEVECDYPNSRIYSCEKKLGKESVVVIPNCNDEPVTAIITKMVKEYVAMSCEEEIEEIICTVDMKSYMQRLHEKNKKAMLLRKMQSKVNEIKLYETLKKLAEKDEGMRALMKEYEGNTSDEEHVNDYE